MKKVLLLGGLGNASVIAFAIIDAYNRGQKDLEFCGYVNDRDGVSEIEGYPVVGGLKDIPRLLDEGYYFINAIGRIGAQAERISLIEDLGIPDDRYVTFIHPLAYIAPGVKMGPGCAVLPNASISPGTVLGKGCRVMINAIIGHNNVIGDYCFFAASSCTGAYLKIGDGVFVSLNATIREDLTLANYSTVGMGAVLTKSTGENEIWIGNPAKHFAPKKS
jgi:sugar O-acyltransferase (sialic acid O-acetyltransferase NeuD family)